MPIKVHATRLYYENSLPEVAKKAGNPFGAKGTDAEIVINRGGGGSSKSHSIMQVLLMKFLYMEKGKAFLVVRKTLPSLKLSTFRLFKKILNEFGMTTNDLRQEKVMMNYYMNKGRNENLLHFGGLDDPEKIKSTDWNYIWAEETTELDKEDFEIMRLYNRNKSIDGKPNQIFLSFNPVSEFHWIKTDLVDDPSYENKKEIVSTYKDNPFLPDFQVKILKDLEKQNPNYYRIYTLGEWGRLENLIYSNWFEVDYFPDMNKVSETIYGLDFGYNNPSALVKIMISNEEPNKCWEQELIYERGLTNNQLINRMKRVIPEGDRSLPIYADSAEPDRIEEIRNAGFNAIPMRKGKNSVRDSIDCVKRWKTIILPGSPNLKKEKSSYCYQTDKSGRSMEAPVKFMDHLMDAERGALWTHTGGSGDVSIRWL